MSRSNRRAPAAGQPQLQDNAAIKVIGLGGVGGIVCRYLIIFLAALHRPCRLVLIDGDSFEPDNASRMLFARAGNKAAVIRDDLLGYFAESDLELTAVEEYVTPENISRLIHDGDIAILAVDNHATRKLVNDYCAARPNVTLISGGNDGVGRDASGRVLRGTYGNCQVYLRGDGQDRSPSLGKYHPEIDKPADRLPSEPSCGVLLAKVPQILFANLTTAAAILNTFWLYLCGELHYSELAFDIHDGWMKPVAIPAPQLRGPEEQHG